jgi:hypothetical protein
MKAPILFVVFLIAVITAQAQIEVINILGPGTMNMTCWEGEANAAFTPGNLNEIQPGETAQVRWAQSGQLDPVTGSPLVRPGTSGPSLVVGDFTGVQSRCAAAMVEVNVGGADEALVVWLAPVIQDPADHTDPQKPSIWSMLLDANNQPLPCSGFQVNSASRDRWQTVPGTADVYHRQWFANLIPLRGYEGRQLLLQLATTDCTKSAHFGYAAMQVYHVSLTIAVKEIACAGGFRLTAPPGASSYQWSCATVAGSWEGESIIATLPGIYTVTMITPSGCEYQMTAEVPTVSKPVTVGSVQVGGKIDCITPGVELTAPAMEDVAQYAWAMAGNNTVLGTDRNFTARLEGTYVLYATSAKDPICDVTREAIVEADMSLPFPQFAVSAAEICAGDSVSFEVITAASAVNGEVEDRWDFGDGTTAAKPSPRAYDDPGAVIIDRMFKLGTCEEHFTQTVTVHPPPRPGVRVLTHCGPARWQRTYEFQPLGIPPSPASLVMTLTSCDGRAYTQQRNGANIRAVVPADSCVHIRIEVVDALGCFGSLDTTFTAPVDPIAAFTWERIVPPGAYLLAIHDSSTNYVEQQWIAVGATITTESLGRAKQFDYDAPGEYVFTLTVTGVQYTCPDSHTDNVVLRQPETEKYFGAFKWPTPFERTIPRR